VASDAYSNGMMIARLDATTEASRHTCARQWPAMLTLERAEDRSWRRAAVIDLGICARVTGNFPYCFLRRSAENTRNSKDIDPAPDSG